MADSQRIDDLRRRVQKDPASIAFAQLAEVCRRAAQFQEAVDVCHAGLEIHPTYLSARVTLGRAFIELNKLDEAQSELELVLKSARENLAAIRGLADIHHRRGELGEALTQYRAALALARNDPELQQTVTELSRKIEPPKPAHSAGGLSFEQARQELSVHAPTAAPKTIAPAFAEPETIRLAPVAPEAIIALSHADLETLAQPLDDLETFAQPLADPETFELPLDTAYVMPFAPAPLSPPASVAALNLAISLPSEAASLDNDSTRARAARTIVALELWLGAIHVARAHRSA